MILELIITGLLLSVYKTNSLKNMCIFCSIVSWDAPSTILYQDDLVTAFFDYFPASSGHLVIVPNKHHENIFETPEETLSHLIKVSKRIAIVYKDILWIEHMNILQNNGALAGQTVFHYHMHIIPRSQWDSVQFWWESHESLRESFEELREKIVTELK